MIYEIDHAYEFRLLPGTPFDENFLLYAEGPDGDDELGGQPITVKNHL